MAWQKLRCPLDCLKKATKRALVQYGLLENQEKCIKCRNAIISEHMLREVEGGGMQNLSHRKKALVC